MNIDNSVKTNLLNELLNANREKYKRLTERRRSFTTKAQINVAISGIFIAIVFNWINEIIHAKINVEIYQLKIIIIATILFLLSILLSIFVLFVGEIPESKECEIITDVITSTNSYSEEDINYMLNDLNTNLNLVNVKLQTVNENKSLYLCLSQKSLSLGIFFIGIASLILILNKII